VMGDFNLDGFIDDERDVLADKMLGMWDAIPENSTLDVCKNYKNELLDHALVFGIDGVCCQLMDFECSDHPALLCEINE